MSIPTALLPRANSRVVELLYTIEVGIRELIIERFDAKFGTRWLMQRVPGGADVKKSLKAARESERRTPWSECIPHHPVYYLDFPLLRQTIERNDNWEQAFRDVFGRKEVVVGALTQLEPIRNKVAHNRMATDSDVAAAEAAYNTLDAPISAVLGNGGLTTLASRCTAATNLTTRLAALRHEAAGCAQSILAIAKIDPLREWPVAHNEWWFDDDYLGVETTPITQYFDAVTEYAGIPRGRGEGYRIERWVQHRGFEKLAADADATLGSLS